MKKILLWLLVLTMCISMMASFSLAGGVELVMWEQSAEWRIKAQQATIDAFVAEHPNVSIRIESFPFVEYQTKINSAVKAGTAADIITSSNQWVMPLINAGLLSEIPANVMSIEELNEDYFKAVADSAVINGKVYLLPNHIGMGIGGLIYNEDLLKEAGIIVPPKFETWEEFMEAAQKCTKFDDNGNMIQVGFSAHGNLEFFLGMSYVLQQGGVILEDNKVAFNNESGLAALQAYQDIFLKYKVDDPLFVGGLSGFPQGRVAMMNIGGWAGKAAEMQNPDLKVGYGDPLPSINADYPAYIYMDGEWAFVIPESLKNKDIVWEFLKFYKTKEQFVERVQYDGELPSLRSAALEFSDDEVMDAYVKSAEYAVFPGNISDREKFNGVLVTYLQELARGSLTPEEALAGLTEDLNKVLSGN